MEKRKLGRKPVFGDRRLTSVQLTPEDRETLELIGQGNMSEGIRVLAEKYRQALARIEEKNAA